jgi:hypothetical protein
MDPITLITAAAIAGTVAIGNKLVEKSTEHLWERFMARLRGKAADNQQAAAALATADDPTAVHQAVVATNAAADPELVDLARSVATALPPAHMERVQRQVIQIAKNIVNAEHVDTMNFN